MLKETKKLMFLLGQQQNHSVYQTQKPIKLETYTHIYNEYNIQFIQVTLMFPRKTYNNTVLKILIWGVLVCLAVGDLYQDRYINGGPWGPWGPRGQLGPMGPMGPVYVAFM